MYTERELKAIRSGNFRKIAELDRERKKVANKDLGVYTNLLVKFFQDMSGTMTTDYTWTDKNLTFVLLKFTLFKKYHWIIWIYMEIVYPVVAYILVYRMPLYLRLFTRVRIFSFLPLIFAVGWFHYATVLTLQIFALFIDEHINLKNVYLFLCLQTLALFCAFLIVFNCMSYVIICFIELRSHGAAIVLSQLFIFPLLAYTFTFFIVPALKVLVIFLDLHLDPDCFYFMQYILGFLLVVLIIQVLRCIGALSDYKFLTHLEMNERLYVCTMLEEIGLYYRNHLSFKSIYQDIVYGPLSIKQMQESDRIHQAYDYIYTILNDNWLIGDLDPTGTDEHRDKLRTRHYSLFEYIGYHVLQCFHDGKQHFYDSVVLMVRGLTAGNILELPTLFELQTTFFMHPIVEMLLEFIDYRDRLGLKEYRTEIRMNFLFYPDVIKVRQKARDLGVLLIEVFKARSVPNLDFGVFKKMYRRKDFRLTNEATSDLILLRTYLLLKLMKFVPYTILFKNPTKMEDRVYVVKYAFLILLFYFLFVELKKVFIVIVFFVFIPEVLISYKLFNHLVAKRNAFLIRSLRHFVLFYALILHYVILIKILHEQYEPLMGLEAIKPPEIVLNFDYLCLVYLIIYLLLIPFIFYDSFYRIPTKFVNLRHLNHAFDVQIGQGLHFQLIFILLTVPAVFCCFYILGTIPSYYFGNALFHYMFDCYLYGLTEELFAHYLRRWDNFPLSLDDQAYFRTPYNAISLLIIGLLCFLFSVLTTNFYFHRFHSHTCTWLVRTRLYNAYLHKRQKSARFYYLYLRKDLNLRARRRFLQDPVIPSTAKIVDPTDTKNFVGSRKKAFLDGATSREIAIIYDKIF